MITSDENFVLKETIIKKTDSTYGFCIKGGRNKPLGIYVTSVVPFSSADISGLAKNDIILSVDEVDFTKLKIDEAIDYLVESKCVHIKLKRSRTSLLTRPNIIKPNKYIVELKRTKINESFGFLVDNTLNGITYENRLFIKSIDIDSLAYHACLKKGDELIEINNKQIHEFIDYIELSNEFKESLTLKLTIKSIDYLVVSNSHNNLFKSMQSNHHDEITKAGEVTDNRKFYRKTSLLFDKILKSKKYKLKHNMSNNNNIIFQPEKLLNIESEIITPELPLQTQTIQDYEYIMNASLNYQSYRSKIIPSYSEITPEGSISIRLIKESNWPDSFGIKLRKISFGKFEIDSFQAKSIAEILKIFEVGMGIKKINENELFLIDNVEDAEYLLENNYRLNRQITLLIKPNNIY